MIDEAVAAIRSGKPVILPTDTVYGLCASPYSSATAERVYRLKGREASKPTALVAAGLDMLFECVPELRGRAGVILRALLPGPFTVVVWNPARRYRWLTGTTPDTIGVRVPELPAAAAAVVERVGAVLATSANAAGGPDPRTVGEVPEEIRAGCAAVVDVGPLPGTPSTVVDVTGPEPRVIREGAVSAAETLERLSAVLS